MKIFKFESSKILYILHGQVFVMLMLAGWLACWENASQIALYSCFSIIDDVLCQTVYPLGVWVWIFIFVESISLLK